MISFGVYAWLSAPTILQVLDKVNSPVMNVAWHDRCDNLLYLDVLMGVFVFQIVSQITLINPYPPIMRNCAHTHIFNATGPTLFQALGGLI